MLLVYSFKTPLSDRQTEIQGVWRSVLNDKTKTHDITVMLITQTLLLKVHPLCAVPFRYSRIGQLLAGVEDSVNGLHPSGFSYQYFCAFREFAVQQFHFAVAYNTVQNAGGVDRRALAVRC